MLVRPALLAASLAALLVTGAGAALPPVQAPAPPPAAVAEAARAPVTILISIDGFRPDYLDRGVTPVLSRLARDGVAASMKPSFPSKTFPNHWTLVTGLVPDRHGIVGNSMVDPSRPNDLFTMDADDPFWWNEAEPLWVTAEKAGVRTATQFWPGANVGWGGTMDYANHHAVTGGTRPSDWHQFAQAVTATQRVDAVIDWMRRPAAARPRFVTLYFDEVDTAGHEAGPDGRATTAAVADVDRAMGRLADGLAALGQPANLVVVADHGMAASSSDRVVALDRLAPPADYRVIESGSYAAIQPVAGREAAVERALLGRRGHATCWRKRDVPARFRYGRNPRVAPILCLADVGWLVNKSAPTVPFAGGNHGYDNEAPEMRALFIANGPAFRAGVRLPAFPNTDVAPLVRRLLNLSAGAGLDGDARPFDKALLP